MHQADPRAEYGPEEATVLRDGRCHLQLFSCLKDRETLCLPFTLHNFPVLCGFMKAISIRYIKLLSLQAPLDNLLISPASSLTCRRRSASPACSIAISVSHNTAAPDGRQGKHLPPELSPIQFPSINQQLGVTNHSLLCLACSCQRLSTLKLHFPSHPVLGEGKAWSLSQTSHMGKSLSPPPPSITPNLLYEGDFVLAFWLGIFNSENEAFWLVKLSMWFTGEIKSVSPPPKRQRSVTCIILTAQEQVIGKPKARLG